MSLNEIIERCAELTEANAHGEAMALAARELGLVKLADRFDRINRQHMELGYLPPMMAYDRFLVYEEMMEAARRDVLTEAEFERFYAAF